MGVAIAALAEKIAREVHAGAQYRGTPFIESYLEPAVKVVCGLGYPVRYQAVTWLHASGDYRAGRRKFRSDELLEQGLPKDVADAVLLCRRDLAEGATQYIQHVEGSKLAVVAVYAGVVMELVLAANREDLSENPTARFLRTQVGMLALLHPQLPKPRGGI